MTAKTTGCPECPHCQAKAVQVPDRVMVASIRSQLRPWEYAGYGQKITGIVDWFDGWWIGTTAETGTREWRKERAAGHGMITNMRSTQRVACGAKKCPGAATNCPGRVSDPEEAEPMPERNPFPVACLVGCG